MRKYRRRLEGMTTEGADSVDAKDESKSTGGQQAVRKEERGLKERREESWRMKKEEITVKGR